MSKETNNYENACNAVNTFLDTMLGAFGVDTTKYHLTEEKLKDALDNSKESLTSAVDELSDTVKKYKEKFGIDFSNLAETLETVLSDYNEKYNTSTNTEVSEETDTQDDELISDLDDICNGDCENCPLCEEAANETYDYDSVADGLYKLAYSKENGTTAYSYESIWEDLYYIMKNHDEEDVEPFTDVDGNRGVRVTYHVGYDTDAEYDTIIGYADRLSEELMNAYGFSEVYISSENNDIDMYVTLYITLIFLI